MSQIVNIQYSIDMQDLEGEVGRLLFRTINKLSIATKELENKSNGAKKRTLLSSELLENITNTRENLAAIDRSLQDVVDIISGYVSYKIDQASPEQDAPEENLDTESAKTFEQQLQNLQETLTETKIENLAAAPEQAELQKKIEDFRAENNLNG
jgi:hypothetical protein|tara:strand:+ start:180 stop:641 length:462 start_codon:yes stop_codon:yes gene_type:complete